MNWFQDMFGTGRRDHDTPPLRPELQQMRACWQGLRLDDDIPDRAAFDPRAIAGLLQDCLLLERIAPGQARIRLAGTNLNTLMGIDLRGMPLFSMIAPETRDRVRPMIEAVFARPAVVTMHLQSERGLMRGGVSAQMALFPLRSHRGDIDRALGILVTEGEPARLPRRFDLTSARLEPIALPLTQDIPEPDLRVAQSVGAAFTSPAQPAPQALATRGHLRLVHSR